MTTKAEFALLWANGKTFGEIYDLMEAEIRHETVAEELEAADKWAEENEAKDPRVTRPQDFMPGDRVRYDDNVGGVIERISSTRSGSDDYLVQWDGGPISRVWGSDLDRVT